MSQSLFGNSPKLHGNPDTWYDYHNQAWVVDGKIDACGHPSPTVGCYACDHAGEPANPNNRPH